MIYKLKRSIRIRLTLAEAWAFFSDPRNLNKLTPESLQLKITSPVAGEIFPGMIITYTVTPLFSIPMNWVTEITHVEKLRMFVDDQRYGPYRLWHHKHFFSEVPGGVLVEDDIDYILPLYQVGMIVHELFVRKQLEEIFDFRAKYLADNFGLID